MSILWILLLTVAAISAEQYSESAVFRKQVDGTLLTEFSFQFSSNHLLSEHVDKAPLALIATLHRLEVAELHVTLTQGRWWPSRWGTAFSSTPPGAEMWAAFDGEVSSTEADSRWTMLLQSLSGMLGAPFPFLTTEHTTSPPTLFFPLYNQSTCSAKSVRHHVRTGQLPRETPCTENLAPWLQLTPCGGAAGVGAMLSAHRACAADYMSIGIHYTRCANGGMQMQLWATTVESLSAVTHPIIRCPRLCPAAHSVRIETDEESVDCLTEKEWFEDISTLPVSPPSVPPLSLARSIRGGHLIYQLTNVGNTPLEVHLFDSLPWFVRLLAGSAQSTGIGVLRVIPTMDHGSPGTVQANASLAPGEFAMIDIQYETAFLHVSEYPPDPHRGFDVGSARAVWFDLEFSQSGSVVTTGGIVDLPTPDFSMPFNVAALTATVHALLFGAVLNVILRRFGKAPSEDT